MINRKELIKENERQYLKEITHSFMASKIYTKYSSLKNIAKKSPNIIVIYTDSMSALAETSGKTALLVFADPYLCGGLFFQGATTQEEMICESSILYNVLYRYKNKGYYELNKIICQDLKEINQNCIYIPDIINLNTKQTFNIIHSAAPNATNETISLQDLRDQIHLIKIAAEDNDIESLILGMYGCGAFENKPFEVALAFKLEFLETSIKNIYYPIYTDDEYSIKEFLKGLNYEV